MFTKSYSYFFSLSLVSVLLFSSCKKDSDPAPSNPDVFFKEGYSPTSIGSTWTYTTEQGTLIKLIDGNVEELGNTNYAEVLNVSDGDTSVTYINKIGEVYSEYMISKYSNVPFLDLSLPVKTISTTTVPTGGYVNSVFTTQVMETGLKKTVNGVEFENVIEVQSIQTYEYTQKYIDYLKTSGNDLTTISSMILSIPKTLTVSYYAKNVGLIEKVCVTDKKLNMSLTSYEIK